MTTRINVYTPSTNPNTEGTGKYVVSDQFGIPLVITGSGLQVGMLTQSEGEDLMEPQNAYYSKIRNTQEELRLQNLLTHLQFKKQEILAFQDKVSESR